MRKLKFKLVRNVIPLYGTSYTTCIGCDTTFNEMLNIKEDCIKQTGRANHAGHNNMRDTLNSTSTSSTSQSRSIQPVSSSTGSVRNNNDVSLIGTSGTSGRHVRSNNSNVSQPNRSNGPNAIDRSAISDNRENHTSWINSRDFNSSENRSNQNQFASRNSRNANNTTWGNIDNDSEIMCHCHETAIQLTVKKEGPNKGKCAHISFCDLSCKSLWVTFIIPGRLFYKCAKPQGTGCSFFLWASDSAESQDNATNQQSSWVSNVDRNNGAGHFSGVGTSNNDWGNPSTNDVMCNCNQSARK